MPGRDDKPVGNLADRSHRQISEITWPRECSRLQTHIHDTRNRHLPAQRSVRGYRCGRTVELRIQPRIDDSCGPVHSNGDHQLRKRPFWHCRCPNLTPPWLSRPIERAFFGSIKPSRETAEAFHAERLVSCIEKKLAEERGCRQWLDLARRERHKSPPVSLFS